MSRRPIDPQTAGTFEITTTVSSLLPTLGSQNLNLVTSTAPAVFVTIDTSQPPVTDRRDAKVQFTPLTIAKDFSSTLTAAISDVPGMSVRDIDPTTILLNGMVPINNGSAIVKKVLGNDVLFVSFNGTQAVATFGTLVSGTTVYPNVSGRFKAPSTGVVFSGDGKLTIK